MFLGDAGFDVVRTVPPPLAWARSKRDGDAAPEDVDVIVVSGTDAARAQQIHERNPEGIVLHLPPFLVNGWAGGEESEGLITAAMGLALRQSSFDGGPIDCIVPIATTLQGVWGAACTVAALLERMSSGRGQIVTVSGEHGAMVASAGALTFRHAELARPAPRRTGGPGGSVPFYRTYRCADGEWLFFGALIPNFTRIGFEVLGLSGLFDDPRLEGRGRAAMLAPEHAPWVSDAIAERFASAPRDEWVARLREAGCPVGAILEREHWLDHPQIEAIGMHERLDGDVHRPGVCFRIEASGMEASPDEPPPPRPASATDGPLQGVRVLDLGAIIAGPFSASLLGELGADVIKVEPLSGDPFRGPGFNAYNKGQRSIALDLRHPDGRTIFEDLVSSADVVIDNYRPGVLARLGVDHASLRRINPRIVSASITGFGERGPFGADAGFDPVLQAMSGMMRAQGGDSDPVFYTVPVNDVAASAVIAFGCSCALFERARTGRAQRVTTSLAATSAFLQAEALTRYDGCPPPPVGSRDHVGSSALDRFYRAMNGWVRIDARDDAPFAALGLEPSAEAIAGWVAGRKRDDAVAELNAHGIPAAPARTVADLAADEATYDAQILQRDPRRGRDASTAGRHALFSRTMRRDVLVSPSLGEHSREILVELGYDAGRVAALLDSPGVGATSEPVLG
jgi:crotonobetainyl-CoA:carnitine CoA-transferase CaiB-like acyl-CoA transferase